MQPRRWTAVLVGSVYFLAGCYTYVPAPLAPSAGSKLAFDLTDAGRAALAERLGPGVTRIEGEVVEANPEQFAVAVSAVSQINAPRSRWSGERIQLRRDYVVRSQERKLSRGRTALAIGAAVAGIVAFAVTRALLGNGGPGRDGGNDGGAGQT